MTYVLVGGLVIAIAGVMLALLADVLRLLEYARTSEPFDQGESRS